MTAVVYLVPAIACLVLYFALGFTADWRVFAWVFAAGEAVVASLHRYFYNKYTSADEYLGGIVKSVHYEAPWVELVRRTETRTDRNGRTYTRTYTVEVPHPPKYYFYTTLGSMILSDYPFFEYVCNIWKVGERRDSWYGFHIKGGRRFGWHYEFGDLDYESQCDITRWIPVTEVRKYKNKIRNSNSIFKYENISHEAAAQEGLLPYPGIGRHDAPCVLSLDFMVPEEADWLFRRFNGGIAPSVQMRLYILLFHRDRGVAIAERQRAYWQGGNKNEMVVCIGTDEDDTVAWASCFSWSDHPEVEVETAQWLIRQKKIDWQQFFAFLSENVKKWKRKEFKDFNYISVSLPLKYFLIILAASIVENAFAVWLIARLFFK